MLKKINIVYTSLLLVKTEDGNNQDKERIPDDFNLGERILMFLQ